MKLFLFLLVSILSFIFPEALSVVEDGFQLAFDPVTAMLGIGAAGTIGNVITGLFGQNAAEAASKRAMEEARLARESALNELAGLSPINLPGLDYAPEQLSYIGEQLPMSYLMPETVEAQTVADSPLMKARQLESLQEMEQLAEEGMSATDIANFMKNRSQVEEAARGREQAIKQSLQSRGMLGSGLEAALTQQAGQAAYDRLSQQQAEQAAANAQMRALANLQAGEMAGQIRGQDVSLSQTNADIINRFALENSAKQQAIKNLNTQLMNEYLRRGTDEQRAVQASNIGERNRAALMQAQQKISGEQLKQQSAQDIAKTKAEAQLDQLSSIYKKGAANVQLARAPYDIASQALGGLAQTGMDIYKLAQQGTANQPTSNPNVWGINTTTPSQSNIYNYSPIPMRNYYS